MANNGHSMPKSRLGRQYSPASWFEVAHIGLKASMNCAAQPGLVRSCGVERAAGGMEGEETGRGMRNGTGGAERSN